MGTGIPEWLDDGASAECGRLTGFERASGRLRKIPRLFSPHPDSLLLQDGILIRRKSQILIDNRTMDTVDEAIRLRPHWCGPFRSGNMPIDIESSLNSGNPDFSIGEHTTQNIPNSMLRMVGALKGLCL